jgi:hypothetical protein
MEDKLTLLQSHLMSIFPAGTVLMNKQYRDLLCSETEKYFQTVYLQATPLASMTTDNAVEEVVKECVKSFSFNEDFAAFLQERREHLGDILWTPALEYEMATTTQHTSSQLLKMGGDDWRLQTDTRNVPVHLGLPFKLREKKDVVTTFSSANSFDERGVWVRCSNGEWIRPYTQELYKEPADFKDAITYVSAPSSLNILALFASHVLIGVFGQPKSFARFDHDIQAADFLDCFVLSSGAVIIKIGKRNKLTGGLSDELCMSFRYGKTGIQPHSLSADEDEEVLNYSELPSSMKDRTCELSVINGDTPQILHANQKIVLDGGRGLACGIVGEAAAFALAYYSGTVLFMPEKREQKLPFMITHMLYQL